MTLLAELAAASARVAETPGRLAKLRILADYLRALAPEEAETAIAYLSGEVPQGKLSLGHAALQAAARLPLPAPELKLLEVDAAFRAIKAAKGQGAAAARSALLGGLLARATAAEQDFLVRLIAGELRQGALEGVMLEALAAAAGVPAQALRRSPRSPSASCSRCCRCWRSPPRALPMPSARSGAGHCSSGSSTAPASRCIRQETQCASIRAA